MSHHPTLSNKICAEYDKNRFSGLILFTK